MKTKAIAQKRDFDGLLKRRIKAGKMFEAGKRQAEVARVLKASRVSVSRWYGIWAEGGVEALRGAMRAGRKAKLSMVGLVKIEKVLREGPKAQGYGTELWTLPRISKVIEKETGVRYHPGHVWKIMRHLGWSLQKPARRAKERNEEKIQKWVKETWPAIKKKPAD